MVYSASNPVNGVQSRSQSPKRQAEHVHSQFCVIIRFEMVISLLFVKAFRTALHVSERNMDLNVGEGLAAVDCAITVEQWRL